MNEKRLESDLERLADATREGVREGLGGDIKRSIALGSRPHKKGMDTVNIIIDLRISKLAAAAVIILTTVLCANFLGGRDAGGNSIFKDSKMLVRYIFGGEGAGREELLAGLPKYEHLVKQGKDVVYYGDSIDAADSNAVLMHWKLADGEYVVIFGDLRSKTISSEALIKLQAEMLLKKGGR